MTPEAVDFYAKKFYPHLLPNYGRLVVQEAFNRHRNRAVPIRRKSPLMAAMLMAAVFSL